VGKPMLIYLKRPAPDQEPRMKAFLDNIREAGTVSYRTFATPRELERLLADDLAVLLSERFAGAAVSAEASPAGPGGPGETELRPGRSLFFSPASKVRRGCGRPCRRRWRWRWSGTTVFWPR